MRGSKPPGWRAWIPPTGCVSTTRCLRWKRPPKAWGARARDQAATRARGEFELPAMGACDAIDDRESETGAAAAASCLVQARERPFQALGLHLRHARAAGHDLAEHAAAIAPGLA